MAQAAAAVKVRNRGLMRIDPDITTPAVILTARLSGSMISTSNWRVPSSDRALIMQTDYSEFGPVDSKDTMGNYKKEKDENLNQKKTRINT